MKKQVKLDTSKLLGVRLADSSAKTGNKGGTPGANAGTKGGPRATITSIGAMAGSKGGPILQ